MSSVEYIYIQQLRLNCNALKHIYDQTLSLSKQKFNSIQYLIYVSMVSAAVNIILGAVSTNVTFDGSNGYTPVLRKDDTMLDIVMDLVIALHISYVML